MREKTKIFHQKCKKNLHIQKIFANFVGFLIILYH